MHVSGKKFKKNQCKGQKPAYIKKRSFSAFEKLISVISQITYMRIVLRKQKIHQIMHIFLHVSIKNNPNISSHFNKYSISEQKN
jgi:hypothetical protein